MATRQADHKRRHDAIEDTDPAAASVSLRPRSQRRVVPESLIAPKNRRDNDTSSTASLPPDEEELEVEMEGAEKKQAEMAGCGRLTWQAVVAGWTGRLAWQAGMAKYEQGGEYGMVGPSLYDSCL